MERSSRAGMWRGWDLNPQSLHVTVMVCCFSWDTRGCWPPACGAHPVLSFPFSTELRHVQQPETGFWSSTGEGQARLGMPPWFYGPLAGGTVACSYPP